jgi:hypothetical protein
MFSYTLHIFEHHYLCCITVRIICEHDLRLVTGHCCVSAGGIKQLLDVSARLRRSGNRAHVECWKNALRN